MAKRAAKRGVAPESAEDRLIARYFEPLATHPGAFGLVDDAAVLTPPPGHDMVLKTDGIIGGVHFFPDDPAGDVARKALRVNLSDLAAKGAKPAGFLLTLALPGEIDDKWLSEFARALAEDAQTYGCPLFGGDTDRTPGPITISIAAFGTLPSGSMVRRATAAAGERVFVTGTIGDAALGLTLRKDADAAVRWQLNDAMYGHLLARYRVPQPRCALAEAVRVHASAAMDVSDGLVGDLAKLCRASGVSADIAVAKVPLSAAAQVAVKAEPALIEPILTGGDDYEIVCTVAADRIDGFRAAAQEAGVPVFDIGEIVAEEGAPAFRDADGQVLAFKQASFSHF